MFHEQMLGMWCGILFEQIVREEGWSKVVTMKVYLQLEGRNEGPTALCHIVNVGV